MANKDSSICHYVDGGCATFAASLQSKLPFPTQRVTWTETGVAPFVHSYRHQVLSYRVGKEVYFIDNFSAGPKWVGSVGDSREAMAMQFRAPERVLISNIVVE